MERREGVRVVEELPVCAREFAVALVEVDLSGELVVVADQQIGPAVAVKVGDYHATIFGTWPAPALETDVARDVPEGRRGGRGEEKGKLKKEEEDEAMRKKRRKS